VTPTPTPAPATATIQIDADERTRIVRRLRRVEGQIAGVIRMLEESRDCREIVTQVAAVSRALDKAGFAIVSSGLRRCIEDPDAAVDPAELERLFLSLA